jgi:hypothetical protein
MDPIRDGVVKQLGAAGLQLRGTTEGETPLETWWCEESDVYLEVLYLHNHDRGQCWSQRDSKRLLPVYESYTLVVVRRLQRDLAGSADILEEGLYVVTPLTLNLHPRVEVDEKTKGVLMPNGQTTTFRTPSPSCWVHRRDDGTLTLRLD